MGNSSSKSSSTRSKSTIKEAIESVERQIDYRPAEADALQKELECLKVGQGQITGNSPTTSVYIDRKKMCSGNGIGCKKHQYNGYRK
jgi:hypothetical protein